MTQTIASTNGGRESLPEPESHGAPRDRVARSLVLIVLLLGVGGLVGWLLAAMRAEPPKNELSTLPPLVETIVVHAQDAVERFKGHGTARPIRMTKIASEVSARVIERVGDIRVGSPVTKGQVLLRLDDREYQHALRRTTELAIAQQAAIDELTVDGQSLTRLMNTVKEEVRVAHDERSRLADLYERKLAAKTEFDLADRTFDQTRRVLQGYERQMATLEPRRRGIEASQRAYEAEADIARLNIERCTIRAPYAGIVQSIMVEVGDRLAPGVIAVTVTDSTRLEVPIQLPASLHHRIAIGTTCVLRQESAPEATWRGRVVRVAPEADERTRTFSIFVEVDNTAQPIPLLPGTFVTAEILGPTHHDALLVPRRACREGRVFIVEGDTARIRTVQTQRLIEDRALVIGALRSGDRVILSHLNQLADGSPVRVRPDRTATTDSTTATDERLGALP